MTSRHLPSAIRPGLPRGLILLTATALLAGEPAAGSSETPEDESREVVVLLHGLGRSDRSMRPLESRLDAAGFRVFNLRYASTSLPPDALIADLQRQIAACCAAAPRLHFVTHSLGGILLRALVATHEVPHLARVVMLAPPNHGSEIVDRFGDSSLFESALGRTASELGTDPESLPNRLPPPAFELGVIAGTASVNPLGSAILPGEDDGAVSVERTRIAGMSDFLELPVSHTFIMRSDLVAQQTILFLRTGRFRHVR